MDVRSLLGSLPRQILFCSVVLIVVTYFGVFSGPVNISPNILWNNSDSTEIARTILFELRIPRTLLALLVGGALAVCGAVMQATFRNSLASPFTLGVSQASAAAVVASMVFGSTGILSPFICSWIGALIAMAVLFFVMRMLKSWSDSELLLTGVMLGIFFSSAGLFLEYVSTSNGLLQLSRWVMGSLIVSGYREVVIAALLTLPIIFLILVRSRALDIVELGPDLALGKGLSYQRQIIFFVIASSVLVATVVGLVGPIGFVGLLIPHLVRLLGNTSYVRIVPFSYLLGGAFLIVADVIARVCLPPTELPVGMITALLGAPCFFLLLIKKSYSS